MNRHGCLIAFGSNLGDSQKVFHRAVAMIGDVAHTQVLACSRPVLTAAVGGPPNQPPFLNAAIKTETSLSPNGLFNRLQHVEIQLGRVRHERWGARTIDLDLLLYDRLELTTDRLTLPHPRMSYRRFVLEPAVEIASDWIHPPSQCNLGELLAQLDTREDLVLVVNVPHENDGAVATNSLGMKCEEWKSMVAAHLELGWRIVCVSELEQFQSLESQAKLVCHILPQGIDPSAPRAGLDILSKAKSFPGPTLQLPDQPVLATTELSAAISAMSPTQK